MNVDTGEIILMNDRAEMERHIAAAHGALVAIAEQAMTPKQRYELKVSDHDHRSELGKLRTKLLRRRSKYTPHVGAKQKAKLHHISNQIANATRLRPSSCREGQKAGRHLR